MAHSKSMPIGSVSEFWHMPLLRQTLLAVEYEAGVDSWILTVGDWIDRSVWGFWGVPEWKAGSLHFE